MEITTGKHQGTASQVVVLNNPDYVSWYMQNHATAVLGRAFKDHIESLDKKPFLKKCHGCNNSATRATSYYNNSDLMFWCDDCDPYSMGANLGKLSVINKYADAVSHINSTANGHKHFMKEIVRGLAQSKGLPKRVSAKAAKEFFK